MTDEAPYTFTMDCPACGAAIHTTAWPPPDASRVVSETDTRTDAEPMAVADPRLICDGSLECEAALHIHGCYADKGACDHSSEHAPSELDTLREALLAAHGGLMIGEQIADENCDGRGARIKEYRLIAREALRAASPGPDPAEKREATEAVGRAEEFTPCPRGETWGGCCQYVNACRDEVEREPAPACTCKGLFGCTVHGIGHRPPASTEEPT